MHFIVAWDIDVPKEQLHHVERKMNFLLNQFTWVRPLEQNMFIVKAKSQTEWNRLNRGLLGVAEAYPEDAVNFIMSPLMSGGTYDGLLKEDLWNDVNDITKSTR